MIQLIKKHLNSLLLFLFWIPDIDQRPKKSWFLNHFAVGGYAPESTESYILYRVFVFALCMYLFTSAIYAIPVMFQVAPEIWGLSTVFPVEHYKDDYPRRIFIFMLFSCCIYAGLISFLNQKRHNWKFSFVRPVYRKNVERNAQKNFSAIRLVYLHAAPVTFSFLACYYAGQSIDFFNSYIFINSIHNFESQTPWNFIVIATIYGMVILGTISNIFCFVFLLLIEYALSFINKGK